MQEILKVEDKRFNRIRHNYIYLCQEPGKPKHWFVWNCKPITADIIGVARILPGLTESEMAILVNGGQELKFHLVFASEHTHQIISFVCNPAYRLREAKKIVAQFDGEYREVYLTRVSNRKTIGREVIPKGK